MGFSRKIPYPPVEDIGHPGGIGMKNIRGYPGDIRFSTKIKQKSSDYPY